VTSISAKENEDGTMDGLWTAEFGSSAGMFGGGTAVFQNGKIMGGDGSYFYLGEYTLQGTAFKATIKVAPYLPNAESVFKTVGRDLTLDLDGSLVGEDRAIAQGHTREIPNVKFGVKLTKRG
jgi:hypothetical protein